jgi:hypothetical protein
MMVLVEIKIYSVILVVKKKYPNEFRPTNFLEKIVATIKTLIYFFVPILNLIAFIGIFFIIKSTDIEQMVEKKYILGVDN